MPCNIPVQKGVKTPSDCKCYSAVMRTYKAMQSEPPHVAREAALRVYCYHHPEDAKSDAYLTVERWIIAEHIH
ncbi:MAG: hypothetical protein H6859_03865 [Rhodospirillales bacterium]|nr:hypothetical protein [Alphaproteobacteria bacterium]USO06334.1 MAG: hypothetical protein H6859_03865 [Rhodospirillales bacterium]